MRGFTYLAIDLGCLLIPLIASFYKPHSFFRHWRAFFLACTPVALFFIVWDVYFTNIGIWSFNPEYLTGIYLFNLPLEEVLFFICIPYACTFTYFALEYLLPNYKFFLAGRVGLLVTVLLLLTPFLFGRFGGWYTQSTQLFLLAFLVFLWYKRVNLAHYYLSYLLILPFFFMSNGLLTGSYLESPIVSYNDSENLGIRMFTIPVEDAFYGMLLIFMNLFGFDFFRGKRRSNKDIL